METNIKMINEMGWTAADAQEALTVAEGNLQGAVNWLLTHAPQGVLVKPAKSPEQVKEAPKSANTSGGAVNIPPPPLDSSDVEDARHLEAMKRNYSTEYVPGHPALQGRTNSGSQEPSPSTSSPAAQPAPSSQNNSTADSSNMVGSNNSAGFTSTVVRVGRGFAQHPKPIFVLPFHTPYCSNSALTLLIYTDGKGTESISVLRGHCRQGAAQGG